MTTAEKKPAVCKRCRDEKAAFGIAPGMARRCDAAGCGRVSCKHLVKHTPPSTDVCGPCNMAASRAAKKAAAK